MNDLVGVIVVVDDVVVVGVGDEDGNLYCLETSDGVAGNEDAFVRMVRATVRSRHHADEDYSVSNTNH